MKNLYKRLIIALFLLPISTGLLANESDYISKPTGRGHPEIARPDEFTNNFTEPYYMVLFDVTLADNLEGYEEKDNEMINLAKKMPGFIGAIASRKDKKLMVACFWKDLASIQNWYDNVDHIEAQRQGEQKWFKSLRLRIAKVERDYTHVIK